MIASDRPSPAVDGSNPALREVMAAFGRHLDLLAGQLEASQAEADRDCVCVGESFHELSAAKAAIERIHCPEPERGIVRDSCRQIDDCLRAAVSALQYHDRLAQRLGLVRLSLVRLRSALHEGVDGSHDAWLTSLHRIEQANLIEQQRLGPSIGASNPAPSDSGLQSSIELF